MVPQVRRMMTPRETCAWLGISRATLSRLARKREIPFLHVGRSLRFYEDEVEGWLESHRGAAGTRTPEEPR